MSLISAGGVDFAIFDMAPQAGLELALPELGGLVPVARPSSQTCTESVAELMRANLAMIFCVEAAESDLRAIWHAMPVIYEAEIAAAGIEAVRSAGRRFREKYCPADVRQLGPVIGHNGLFMMRWDALRDGSRIASGCHLALIRDGRIDTFYALED
jgi:hypothetical protein